MIELKNWKAKRAGGRITITGVDQHGQPLKVAGFDLIEPGKLCAIATHMSGDKYVLHNQPAD